MVAAGVALLAVMPAAAHAQAVTISVTPTGSPGCTRFVGPCSLTQAFALAAQNGDTLQFSAGVFTIAATTTFAKRLTYLGARAGVSGVQRDPSDGVLDAPETILSPAPGANVAELLTVQAQGITVDGFTFRNPTGGLRICCKGSGFGGHTIINNVFTHNVWGVYPQTSGAASLIADNLFLMGNRGGMYLRFGDDIEVTGNLFAGNGTPGTGVRNAIYADDGANGVTISGNRFTGNDGATLAMTLKPEVHGSGVTFSGNTATGDESGVNVRGVNNLTITGNVIQGSDGSGVGINGNDQNVMVRGNLISGGGASGIILRRLVDPDPENGDVEIRENTITGNAGRGIFVGANGSDGGVKVRKNRIVDNADGLRNEDGSVKLQATPNWWGCNLGPGQNGCDSVTSPGGVNPQFAPWLTLSLRATPAEIDAGQSNSLLARLSNLSDGTDPQRLLPQRSCGLRFAARGRDPEPGHRDPEHRRPGGHVGVHRRASTD